MSLSGPPAESPMSRNIGWVLCSTAGRGQGLRTSIRRSPIGDPLHTRGPGALRVELERQHAGEYCGHSRVISRKVRGASHGIPSRPNVADVVRSRFDSDESR